MTPLHQAPDAHDEPTLWSGPSDHPTAVLRRCDAPVAFDALVAALHLLTDDPMHADTCATELSPGAGYPCNCWQAHLRAALTPATHATEEQR